MKLHVFIKKTTLTPEINSKYWETFGRLFELPLNEQQIVALIDFFEGLEAYRNYIVATLSISQGSMVKFLRTEHDSQEVFIFFALVDPSQYKTIVKAGPQYENYIVKKDRLFGLLGWTEIDERVVEIESEIDEETLVWSGLPKTFEEGLEFFERGISVSEFFKD